MPFCSECGKDYPNSRKFCPFCGTPNDLMSGDESSFQTSNSSNTANTASEFQTQKHAGAGSYGAYRLEDLPEGFVIDDRYEVKRKLGQGGFGAVYLAFDKKMAINKALKIIPDSVASDEEAMNDLRAEARTMVSLNHENIVRVYDVHDSGSIKYIDMEYVDGKALNAIKLASADKKIPEAKVKAIGIKIARGLAYAHKNKVIHKDIKPANIMLAKGSSGGNIVKIMDFGISETVRTSMSRVANSSSSGTLVYMAPEQVKGADVGAEADIYSFGAMLYELLSGHPPFYKGDIHYQLFNEKPADLEGVSSELNEVIQKCLAKDYRDRYRNFEEVVPSIQSLRDHSGTGSSIQSLPFDKLRAARDHSGTGDAGSEVKTVKKQEIKAAPKKVAAVNTPASGETSEKKKKSKFSLFLGFVGAAIAIYLGVVFFVMPGMYRRALQALPDKRSMVQVTGGSFQMGSTRGDSDEEPVHKVTLSKFYISKYEVTQGLFKAVMGSTPSYTSYGIGDNYPVNNVSWYDAVKFCNKLSAMDELQSVYRINGNSVSMDISKNGYRLPIEAEWEYAAKGGAKSKGYKYAGSNSIDRVAWYDDNSGGKTHPVGGKQANELGLYDMSGNVWEWCWDWKGSYSSSNQSNPQGASSGSLRVDRGGSWGDSASYGRSANRFYNSPGNSYNYLGFRLVRSTVQQ